MMQSSLEEVLMFESLLCSRKADCSQLNESNCRLLTQSGRMFILSEALRPVSLKQIIEIQDERLSQA